MFDVNYSIFESSARSSSSMCWCRKKEDSAGAKYELLAAEEAEGRWKRPAPEDAKVPRGCVPVLVGKVEKDGSGGCLAWAPERFVVNVKVLKDPRIGELLEMGAQEFGERQAGILRIPCDAEQFRRVLSFISAAARR